MNNLLKITRRLNSSTNYYKILGVKKNCTMEEIEKSFSNLLKKHNFQLNNLEKPKELDEIFKAYGILSLETQKISYSTHKTKSFEKSPQIPLPSVQNDSYRQEITQKKKDLKKKYNYNQINRYNGGVPNPNLKQRGTALGAPGEFHSPSEEINNEKLDSDIDFRVNSRDAEEFSQWHKDDRPVYDLPKSWLEVKVVEGVFGAKRYWFLFGLVALFVGVKFGEEVLRIGYCVKREKFGKLGESELVDGFLVFK